MDDILRNHRAGELSRWAAALQSALFDPKSDGVFDAQGLLATIKALRSKQRADTTRARREAAYQLPPLYRH
jgi:hypothetical protein